MMKRYVGALLGLFVLTITPACSAAPPPPRVTAERIAAEHPWMRGALALCSANPDRAAAARLSAPPPTAVFDDLYYLGTGAVSAWALRTDSGIILIDTLNDADQARERILGGMAGHGLDPNDVRYVIVTHGHGDHVGGAMSLMRALPHARLVMAQAAYDVAHAAAKGDAALLPFPAIRARDGETITLGGRQLRLYDTPGHSPGTISLIFTATDHGVSHRLALWGGSASYNLSQADLALYSRSVRRFAALARAADVDTVISNHPMLDDSATRIAARRASPAGPSPYVVGKGEVAAYYRLVDACARQHMTTPH